jgi:hypothetical protein
LLAASSPPTERSHVVIWPCQTRSCHYPRPPRAKREIFWLITIHCSPDCTLHTAHCTLHTAHCTLHTAHYARLLPLQPPHERLFSHQTPVSAHGLMIPTLFAPSSRTWILTYQANLGPRRPVRPVTLSLVQPLPALAAHALFLRLPSIMIFRGGPQGPSKPPPTTCPAITCPCCLSAITITLP